MFFHFQPNAGRCLWMESRCVSHLHRMVERAIGSPCGVVRQRCLCFNGNKTNHDWRLCSHRRDSRTRVSSWPTSDHVGWDLWHATSRFKCIWNLHFLYQFLFHGAEYGSQHGRSRGSDQCYGFSGREPYCRVNVSLMPFQVQSKQCATCIYFPKSGFDINVLEAEIADPYMKGFFAGHRTCHHSDTACCRGFWNRHKDHFTTGQIAQRLNQVQFVEHDTMKERISDE